jgi:hypothetical protein
LAGNDVTLKLPAECHVVRICTTNVRRGLRFSAGGRWLCIYDNPLCLQLIHLTKIKVISAAYEYESIMRKLFLQYVGVLNIRLGHPNPASFGYG